MSFFVWNHILSLWNWDKRLFSGFRPAVFSLNALNALNGLLAIAIAAMCSAMNSCKENAAIMNNNVLLFQKLK